MEWLPCVPCLEFVDRQDRAARKIEGGVNHSMQSKILWFFIDEGLQLLMYLPESRNRSIFLAYDFHQGCKFKLRAQEGI